MNPTPEQTHDLLQHIREAAEFATVALDRRDALLKRPWMLVATPYGIELPWELRLEAERCHVAKDRLENALELLGSLAEVPDDLLALLVATEERLFCPPDPRAFPAARADNVVLGEIDRARLAAGRALSQDLPVHGGSPSRGFAGSPPHASEKENRPHPTPRGRHAPRRPRSIAALEREVARLEVRLRREQAIVERAYARCVIAGAPLPPAPPGMGARHRAAWERAQERAAEVSTRLEAARQALAEAQASAEAR